MPVEDLLDEAVSTGCVRWMRHADTLPSVADACRADPALWDVLLQLKGGRRDRA
jgi:hypothetical protein